jgi:hypothetical protein
MVLVAHTADADVLDMHLVGQVHVLHVLAPAGEARGLHALVREV